MTSRNLFFKLMKEDMKRRYWAIGLGFLMFFFWLPVAAAMGSASIAQNYEDWLKTGTFISGKTPEVMRYERMIHLMEEVVGLRNPMTAVTIVCASIILGLTGFHYLHSKKQVDFYHSIPVRRETIFGVHYLNGVLIVLVTYGINMLLALGVFAVNGLGLSETLKPAVLALVVQMTGFLLHYGLMIIAVLLTGNFFISILGGFVLFSYVPLVSLLIEGLMELFFVTVQSGRTNLHWYLLHGSPFTHYLNMLSETADQKASVVLVLCGLTLVAALVMAVVSLILYRLRPSEAAGKAMAFKVTRPVIKILLVVPCTIAMSLLFWGIYYTLPWAVFGFVMGLIVSHCIIEVIYHFEFRKLFANLPQMAVCAVLALAVIGAFRYDIIGFDKYIPGEQEFQSAALNVGSLEDWNHRYGLPVQYESGSHDWKYLDQATYVEENMEIIDYATVKAIADASVSRAAETKEWRLDNGNEYFDRAYKDGEYWSYIDMVYTLKNGKKVYRSYEVEINGLRPTFDKLYDSSEYKKGVYPVLNMNFDSVMGIYAAKAGEIKKVEAEPELMKKLFETYQKELTALTLSDRATETPVTSLRFLTSAERDYLSLVTHSRRTNYTGLFDIEDMEQVNFFPVYPSFTETIALLQSAGLNVTGKLSVDDVERIEVVNRFSYKEGFDPYASEKASVLKTSKEEITAEEIAWEQENSSMGSVPYADVVLTESVDSEKTRKLVLVNDGTGENTEKIQEILDCILPEDMVQLNGLQIRRSGAEVLVYLKSVNEGRAPSDQEFSAYVFDTGELPEFYKEEIHYDQVVGDELVVGIGE